MAFLGPHPALKVAAPEGAMLDGWMGDDWFHYCAFRQVNLDYFTEQTSKTGKGDPIPRWGPNAYQEFLDAGSDGNWANQNGFRQLGLWSRLSAHPPTILYGRSRRSTWFSRLKYRPAHSGVGHHGVQ
jgi:predicted acyl esterase